MCGLGLQIDSTTMEMAALLASMVGCLSMVH